MLYIREVVHQDICAESDVYQAAARWGGRYTRLQSQELLHGGKCCSIYRMYMRQDLSWAETRTDSASDEVQLHYYILADAGVLLDIGVLSEELSVAKADNLACLVQIKQPE